MNVWIDIDNEKHIPFLKAIINELKERGHGITVTAQKSNTLKKELEKNDLNAKAIGFVISIFGLFKEQSYMFRTVFLINYLKGRSIDVAFSLGSKCLLYVCASEKTPIILFLENIEERPHMFHFGLEKSFFIVSEDIQDQRLIDKGFDISKVTKYKGNLEIEKSNFDLRVIKEIVNKIELLGKHIPGGLMA